jgi:hypothetical protein
VVTVRLSFVARTSGSIDSATNAEIGARLTPETLTYKFDRDGDGIPESITTSDGRLRRVFTSTIGLRNRLR